MTVEQADHVLAWLDAYENAQREAHDQMKRR